MLVLSRKENESIEFPSLGVVVRVIGLTRKRVQLGIDAPVSLKVIRSELSPAGSMPGVSVDSVAEHVIGEEFKRLESELAALAELAGAKDQRLARQIATDLIARTTGIRRAVTASLRGRDKKVADDLREGHHKDRQPKLREKVATSKATDHDPACVRQSPSDYAVSPRITSALEYSASALSRQ
jgi:carbon storage regulator CsrA